MGNCLARQKITNPCVPNAYINNTFIDGSCAVPCLAAAAAVSSRITNAHARSPWWLISKWCSANLCSLCGMLIGGHARMVNGVVFRASFGFCVCVSLTRACRSVFGMCGVGVWSTRRATQRVNCVVGSSAANFIHASAMHKCNCAPNTRRLSYK